MIVSGFLLTAPELLTDLVGLAVVAITYAGLRFVTPLRHAALVPAARG
jgi:hypothetical protein